MVYAKCFHDISINQKVFKQWSFACWIIGPMSALANYIGLESDDDFLQYLVDKAINLKILDIETGSNIGETLPFICNEFNQKYKFKQKIWYQFEKDMSFQNIFNILNWKWHDKQSPIMVGLRLSKSFKKDIRDDWIVQWEHSKIWKWHFSCIVKAEKNIIWQQKIKIDWGLWEKYNIFELENYHKVKKKEEIMSFLVRFVGLPNGYK